MMAYFLWSQTWGEEFLFDYTLKALRLNSEAKHQVNFFEHFIRMTNFGDLIFIRVIFRYS
jgi:hypothetical protein